MTVSVVFTAVTVWLKPVAPVSGFGVVVTGFSGICDGPGIGIVCGGGQRGHLPPLLGAHNLRWQWH